MTMDEFHKARRMFAVVGETVLVAPPESPLTHRQWLTDLFGGEVAERILYGNVRGYVLRDCLVAYQSRPQTDEGRDEFSDAVDLRTVLRAYTVMGAIALKTVPIRFIGLGAVPSSFQPWPTRREFLAHLVYPVPGGPEAAELEGWMDEVDNHRPYTGNWSGGDEDELIDYDPTGHGDDDEDDFDEPEPGEGDPADWLYENHPADNL